MRRYFAIFLTIAALAGCSKDSTTASQPMENHTIEQKLSNDNVIDFAQDNDGFIWIATARGLSRYDGHSFHTYLHSNSDPKSLPANMVISLLCSSDGTLWAGTMSGPARMDERGDFIPVTFDHSDYRSESVLNIEESTDGKIYLSTGDILQEYDKDSDSFISRMEFENGKALHKFALDEEDRFWYLSEGIVRMKESLDSPGRGEVLEALGSGIMYMTMLPNSVLCTYSKDGSFHVWSIEMGMELYNGKPGAGDIFSSDNVIGIFPHSSTSFFISTRHDGVFIFESNSGELTKVDSPEETKCIFMDKSGDVWFGTEKSGFEMRKANEMEGSQESRLIHLYKGVQIQNLTKDSEGNILINTSNSGLFLFRLKNGSTTRIEYEQFLDAQPLATFIDSERRLWIATENRCMVFAMSNDCTLKQITSFNITKGEMFFEDSFGDVWLATRSHSIYVCKKGSNSVESIRLDVESGYMFIPEITQTHDGTIIFPAFLYGVYKVDPKTLETELIVDLMGKLNSNFMPNCIMEDSDGVLWIGTVSDGLYTYDMSHEELTHIDDIDCEIINSILESQDGNIWASTADGLYCYNRSNGSVLHYTNNDGIIEGQLADHSGICLPYGNLIFGGTEGIFNINPSFTGTPEETGLFFDDLFINGSLARPCDGGAIDRPLCRSPRVKLKKGSDSIDITFSAPDYSNTGIMDFKYIMEGYDPAWQQVRFENRLSYSHLPEGRYTLRLEEMNRVTGEKVSEASLDIRVTSPFFSSKIMRRCIYPLLLLFAMVMSILAYFKYKKNEQERQRILREKEDEENLNKMNLSFFTNMSHEFRTPLTLIAGPVSEISEELEDTPYNRGLIKTVNHSVSRMLKLVDQIMDFSKLETDAMNLSLCDTEVNSVFEETVSQFRISCSQKNIKLEIDDNNGPVKMLADTDKIEKILTNILSNAVKYTPGGNGAMIRASLETVSKEQATKMFRNAITSESESFMLISVTDTGPGIPDNMKEEIFERYRRIEAEGQEKQYGSGIGLYYARRLATLHHGIIEAADSPSGKGSCFRLLLPMDRKEYEGEIIISGAPADIVSAPAEEIEEQQLENPGKPIILLVEDDLDVASYISSLLGKYYDVRVKYNADDAWDEIKVNSPDLVITDVMVPGDMDGLALCTSIKEKLETSHIPVMILSAKCTMDDQIRGLETGADSYVTKPVVPAYLLTLTKTLLSNRDKLRTNLKETTNVSEISEESLSSQDRYFLENLCTLMENQLGSSELNVDMVAEALKMSRAKLYYKFKGLMNETPNTFFKKYKLNRAAELLKSGKYNISEVADKTGFSSLSYFSVSFKKQFGVKPSDYL